MSSLHDPGSFGITACEQFVGTPVSVVVDSWFLRRAMDTRASGHPEAAAFLQRLDLLGTDCYYSGLTELVLIESAHSIGQPEMLAEWNEVKGSTRVHWVSIDAVTDDVEELVADHGLTASGAVQVATAIAVEAEALVTVDPAFGSVDAATLQLLVDSASVGPARRHRR